MPASAASKVSTASTTVWPSPPAPDANFTRTRPPASRRSPADLASARENAEKPGNTASPKRCVRCGDQPSGAAASGLGKGWLMVLLARNA
jgi:hypothetical protein